MSEDGDRSYYRWRQMTQEQRQSTLAHRQQHWLPWHSPPHYNSETDLYLVTAACYEHMPIVGYTPERMVSFEKSLVETCQDSCQSLYAWTVLPNHYHVLVKSADCKGTVASLGRLHGRTSFKWNGEEERRGRKVWFNAAETAIKSERHFWAALIYVMHNAVKHRYVERWQDWPFSNASDWLEVTGRDEAVRIWKEYPIDDFGRDWDPPDL